MKKYQSGDLKLFVPKPVTTSEKLTNLLKSEFSSQQQSRSIDIKSLQNLEKYAKRLASELSFNPAKINFDQLSKEHLLTYALLLISDAKSYIINESPNLYQTNQLSISIIARSFGVPQSDDTETLLSSIGSKFKIYDSNSIGDELAERLLCVPKIVAYFGLDKKDPNILFNPDKLCDSIRRKCENNTFFDRIVANLGLPADATESQVMKSIARLMQFRNQPEQIQFLKMQNQELRDKFTSIKKLTQNSKESINSPTSISPQNSSRFSNSDLEGKVDDLEILVQNLKKQNAELKKQLRDPMQYAEKYKQANKQLEKQLESQIAEIADITLNRKNLITVIKKQSQLITEYEKSLSEKDSNQLASQILKLRQIQAPPVDDHIFEVILDSIENAPPDIVDGVLKINKNASLNRIDKVKKIVAFFIDEIRKERQSVGIGKSSQGECERLITAMHSQLRFLENLVSCDDDIHLLFEEADEARTAIQEQVVNIESFLNQHAKGFVEDANIFDTLQLNVNPLELSKRIQSFLDRYPTIRTPEGDELFVMLRMSLAANGILRRFAITTRNQAEKQTHDLRALTKRLEKARIEREKRNAYSQQIINNEIERREIAENNLQKVKRLIQSSNGKLNDNPQLIEFIDQRISESTTENEYQKSIERQLSQALQELSKAQQYIDESKEITAAQEANLNEEYQQEIERRNTVIETSVVKINSLEKEVDSLNEKLAFFQVLNDKLNKELSDITEKHNQTVKQIKAELHEKYTKENDDNLLIEAQKSDLQQQRVDKMLTTIKEMKSTIAEKDAVIEKLNKHLAKQKASNKKLDQLLRETQKKQISTEYEFKILQQRVQELEDKLHENASDEEELIY